MQRNISGEIRAAHSKVHALHAAVYIIHRSDDINILWHEESILKYVAILHQILILRLHLSLLSTIPRVNRKEQFAKYLRDLSTINFVDDENERRFLS